MNYASLKNYDIANGKGVRVSLFVSGCRHYCKNCFNAEAWDFNYGQPFDQSVIDTILEWLKPSYIAGLSLLGGEPLEPENQHALLDLCTQVKQMYPTKNIWCYSGFTFEHLMDVKRKTDPDLIGLLQQIDILVDGPFVEELKNPGLAFRGSSNQRILDCKASVEALQPIVIHMDQ